MLIYDIQDLVKYYPKQDHPANNHISLQIHQGEIFGILGDNGAGKTTLVRQMVNLLRSTSGTIKLFGNDITRHPQVVTRFVGYMPQASDALNNLSVKEALYFTAHLRGMSRADARKECEYLLELWQLAPIRNHYSSRLSGGQKRLLRLAVATAGHLPVLMLDEPTNDLDPLKRKLVWDVLRQINSERGTTIIFITHDAIEAEKIIQRVGIMHQGAFVALGDLSTLKQMVSKKLRLELFFAPDQPPALPTQITHQELHPGRWLVLLNNEDAPELMQTLQLDQLYDFRLYTATLEDVYLHYANQHATQYT